MIKIVCSGAPGSHKWPRTIERFARPTIGGLTLGWSAQTAGSETTLMDDSPATPSDWAEIAEAAEANRGEGGNPPIAARLRRRYLLKCSQCNIAYPVRRETLDQILDDVATRGESSISLTDLGARLSSR